MTNTAVLLLFDEVIRDAPLFVKIDFDGCLIDIVEQVEVEVFGTAFGQLLFEDRGGIIGVGDLVARILGGEEVAIAWIMRKRAAKRDLGHATMIGIGCIEIIDACFDGRIDHSIERYLIDVGSIAVYDGKAHGPESQPCNVVT